MVVRVKEIFNKHTFVIGTLFLSAILRWILIFRGGQFYFSDENRYGIAQDALVLLLDGKVKTALLTLVDELAHVGFKFTALIPALFENLFNTSLALPAIFFSFFSILNLLMIWMIALRAGAPVRVANYALLMAACSQVLLYYARHLFPYDQAMFFGLLALYFALENRASPRVSFLCGSLSFFCLVTYNGYWPLSLFPMLVHLFSGPKEGGWIVKRTVFLGLGFLAPLVLLLIVCLVIGKNIFSDYGVYVQKIVQGSFSEGWSLPFEFFWHAEHGLILLLGLLILVALFHFLRQRNRFLSLALGGILFIYLCLAIPSNVTQTFVVYARTARQWMPFLVLSAAYGLSALQAWKPGGQWLASSVVAIVLIQAVWNYRASYQIVYPREFIREIQEQYPEFEVSSKMMRFYSPLICQNQGFLLVNFHYIYNRLQTKPDIRGELLLQAPHPVNFWPYLYEGYTPEEREAIRNDKTEMAFYKLDASFIADHKKDIEKCNQKK